MQHRGSIDISAVDKRKVWKWGKKYTAYETIEKSVLLWRRVHLGKKKNRPM
jgi:hypothetical protein